MERTEYVKNKSDYYSGKSIGNVAAGLLGEAGKDVGALVGVSATP